MTSLFQLRDCPAPAIVGPGNSYRNRVHRWNIRIRNGFLPLKHLKESKKLPDQNDRQLWCLVKWLTMAVTYRAVVEYIQKRLFCDLWSQDSNSLQLCRVSFSGETTQTKHLSKIWIARDMKSCRKLGSLEPGSHNFCSFCDFGDMFCFLRRQNHNYGIV